MAKPHTPKTDDIWVTLHTKVHREVLRHAKIEAIQADLSLRDFLHRTLCHALDMEEIAMQSPDTISA